MSVLLASSAKKQVWPRGDGTGDVAQCRQLGVLPGTPAPGGPQAGQGATVPPRQEPGKATTGKLWRWGLWQASPRAARLPGTLGRAGNTLPVWKPRDLLIPTESKAMSKLILIYSPQEKQTNKKLLHWC